MQSLVEIKSGLYTDKGQAVFYRESSTLVLDLSVLMQIMDPNYTVLIGPNGMVPIGWNSVF